MKVCVQVWWCVSIDPQDGVCYKALGIHNTRLPHLQSISLSLSFCVCFLTPFDNITKKGFGDGGCVHTGMETSL